MLDEINQNLETILVERNIEAMWLTDEERRFV